MNEMGDWKEILLELSDNKGSYHDLISHFKIECLKCKSKQISIITQGNTHSFGSGCPTCGYGSDDGTLDIELIFKCNECGNAFTLMKHDVDVS